MTEYKKIDEKEIWIVMRTYIAGKQEFIGAYWSKELAKQVATENITDDKCISITIHSIMLHESMIDKQ